MLFEVSLIIQIILFGFLLFFWFLFKSAIWYYKGKIEGDKNYIIMG